MYSSLGRWCYRHPWRVLGAWLLIIVMAAGVARGLGAAYGATPTAPDSESTRGADILGAHFGNLGATISGTIVFRAEQGVNDPPVRAAMTDLFDKVETLERIDVASPYDPDGGRRVAARGPDAGRIAYANLEVSPDTTANDAAEIGLEIDRLINASGLRADGVQVEIGGSWLSGREPPESEAIGLAFAVLVLILAVGSVVAMGMTIGTRPGRRGRRRGRRDHPQQRCDRPGVRPDSGDHDRHRRGHRLRPVHHHPLPGMGGSRPDA